MKKERPKILLVFDRKVRDVYILQSDLDRLETFANWEWLELEGGENFDPNEDPSAIERLMKGVSDIDGVTCKHAMGNDMGMIFFALDHQWYRRKSYFITRSPSHLDVEGVIGNNFKTEFVVLQEIKRPAVRLGQRLCTHHDQL